MLSLGLALLVACAGSDDAGEPAPAPEGPAEVRVEVVEEHAAQFDEELPERSAGSQEEFAAATYLTAHLQRAGYEVRLESVPFKDTVRSTNVVALPPGGGDPTAVVAVPYDSAPSGPRFGRDLGLFLELARALRVRAPEHNVQFVALGAELTAEGGGNLGSRVLARELAEVEDDPPVISVMVVPGGGFRAGGPAGDELEAVAGELEPAPSPPVTEPIHPVHLRAAEIFADAGIRHAVAAGGVEGIGRVLLEYLSR